MAEFDHIAAMMGEWVPSSPSPKNFFSQMLNHEDDLRSVSELWADVKTSGEAERKDPAHNGHMLSEGIVSEQKSGARGGLGERIAARAGFSAPKLNTENIRPADFLVNPDVRSPYLLISPGFSPTMLLESPVFLSNSLVQPSPTTGKVPLLPNDKNPCNWSEDVNMSSFTFKPVCDTSPFIFPGETNNIVPSITAQQSFPSFEASAVSNTSLQSQSIEANSQNQESANLEADFSRSLAEKDSGNNAGEGDQWVSDTVDFNFELSPQHDEEDQASADIVAPAEDGYSWRKYGQKQVKGCEHPRSYFKCTHPNCQVKKKVEQSYEGHITAIIYKGAHNHPKPPPNFKSATGSYDRVLDMPVEQRGQQIGAASNDSNVELASSTSAGFDYDNSSTSLQPELDPVNDPSNFSNEEDDDDHATHGSMSLGCEDGDGDEPESKRRKLEAYATEMTGATRAIREPRVVVQTTSDIDILDDGYRWRKYGQKVVKGNPNPRSYYKCTSAGCNVRKHVERASHDLKSVITTYEGKHNHEVPAARNSSSHSNSTASTSLAAAPRAQTGSTSQAHNNSMTSRFGKLSSPFSPFGLRHQLGLPPFSFGLTQPGFSNLLMNQPAMFGLPMNPYWRQQCPVKQPGLMLPKEEPKPEAVSEPAINRSNGSSVYQEIMHRLHLGQQM